MSDIYKNEAGEAIKWDARNQQWVDATKQELEVAEASAVGSALLTGVDALTGSVSMMAPEYGAALQDQNPGIYNATLAGSLLTGGAGALGTKLPQVGAGMGRKSLASGVSPLARPMVDRLGGRNTVPGRVAQYATAAAEATPGVGLVPLWRRASNARKVNMSVARGMGFDDWKNGSTSLDDVLQRGLPELGERFNGMSKAIDAGNIDQLQMNAIKEAAIDYNMITDTRLARKLSETSELSGREIMAMRSNMGKLLRGNVDAQVREQVQSAIDEIDDIIEAALPKASMDDFRDMRARWRLWAATRNSITPDGQVSIRGLNNSLKNSYGDKYRTGNIDDLNLPEEVSDALKYVREGAAYEAQMLQSSGTAERIQYTTLGTAAGLGALSELND